MRPQRESSVVLRERFTSRPLLPHFLHLLRPPTSRLLPHENCDSYARCQTEHNDHRQDRQEQSLYMQRSCVILMRECVKCGNRSLRCCWQRINCGGELWKKLSLYEREPWDQFYFLFFLLLFETEFWKTFFKSFTVSKANDGINSMTGLRYFLSEI